MAGAFACGVHAILDFRSGWLLDGAGMMSPDGRCKTLDAKVGRGKMRLESTKKKQEKKKLWCCTEDAGSFDLDPAS